MICSKPGWFDLPLEFVHLLQQCCSGQSAQWGKLVTNNKHNESKWLVIYNLNHKGYKEHSSDISMPKKGYFYNTTHLTDIDPSLIFIIGPVAHS